LLVTSAELWTGQQSAHEMAALRDGLADELAACKHWPAALAS